MTTVRRAIVFSFLESYFGLALSIVSFTLLARLLTPQQIGLFSVALAIISVMQVVRDFGLVNFLIQKKDLTPSHISTVWGVSLLLGSLLFVLVQALAPAIGQFYDDQAIQHISRIVALNFLLLPFNSVCLALLKRDMQFQMVMRINMTAAFVGTIGTLLLAWLGWGALSLAIGSVANSAVVTISLLLQGAPSRLGRPSLEKMREVLAFGGPLTAANVITSISIDINDLAVGKLMGFKEVAIISRGQGLMNLFHRDFMGAVRNVVFPAFSQANRDGEPMEVKYIATVTAVTVIAWPFYGFMSLFPLDVIRLMFGTQWDAAAAFVPFFCIAGAFSATINLINPLLLALGHSHLVSLAEFILQPIKAITLTAVIFYFKELRPFAIAFLAIAILAVPYTYYFKQRRVPTDFGLLGKKLGTNLLITGACLFPAGTLAYSLRNGEAPLAVPLFLACAVLTFAAWIACLVSIDHPLYQEGRQMMQRRRKNAVGAEPAV